MNISSLGPVSTVFTNKWVLMVIVGLGLFAGGMAVGRFGLPAKVVVTERVKEVTKEVVVVQVKTEVQVVRVKDASTAERTHRTIEETTAPNGTKTKVTKEDIGIDIVVHEHDQEVKVVYVDKFHETDKTKESTVTKVTTNSRPNWRVGATAGVSIPYFLTTHTTVGVPGLQGFVIGATVERRILGPLWGGLFGNTQGVAGISLSGEF